MNRSPAPVFATIVVAALAACGTSVPAKSASEGGDASTSAIAQTKPTVPVDGTNPGSPQADNVAQAKQTVIRLAFGNTVMTAVLDDSETSRAFVNMLPLTLTMSRYADREYYAALGELPESGVAIDDYENGDVTYYTDGNSLAIFFGNADVSSQDGLIRMGRITSDLSLFDSVGESAEVTISLSSIGSDSTAFDFSIFKNVEVTGINASELSAEEKEVLYQQARYCEAMTEADTETMRKITSPDMVFAHMSGRRQTREEYFADIENGSLRYFTIGIDNPVVSINGSYASVSYTSVSNANAYGARGTYRIDGTHWYKKLNESWLACNAPEQ